MDNRLSADQQPQLDTFSMFGTTFRGAEITQSPASDDARQKIRRSFMVAAASPAVTFFICLMERLDIRAHFLQIALSVYVGWASYLGIVAVMRVLADFGEQEFGLFSGKLLLQNITYRLPVLGIIFVTVLPGVVYGVLGGAVYELLIYRKIVKNPALTRACR